MGQGKRECIDNWTDFLRGNKISELWNVLKIMLRYGFVYVNKKNIRMIVCLHDSLRKSTSETEVKFFVFFSFFIKFVLKTLIKSIIYC